MANGEQEGLSTVKDVNIEEIDVTIHLSENEDEPENQDNESSTLPNAETVERIEILMVGLDNSGKTKLLYTLQLGHVEHIIPTIGYNVEKLEHNDHKYEIWDIGGHKNVRVLRNFYTEKKSFVIYVVDASDATRFEEAQQDLHDVMNNSNLTDVVLLVLANKMDLVPEFEAEDLAKHLKLETLKQKWMIHGCSAVKDGNRLYEILELLQP